MGGEGEAVLTNSSSDSSLKGRSLDAVDQTFPPTGIQSLPRANSADFLDRPLGPEVLRPDEEDNIAYKAEGVTKHEPLHLSVVHATPV